MRVQHEFGRDHLFQPELHFQRRLARRKPRAIADAEHMRIDRHGGLAEGHVEHDIRRLAPGARQ